MGGLPSRPISFCNHRPRRSPKPPVTWLKSVAVAEQGIASSLSSAAAEEESADPPLSILSEGGLRPILPPPFPRLALSQDVESKFSAEPRSQLRASPPHPIASSHPPISPRDAQTKFSGAAVTLLWNLARARLCNQ
eukprot:scaffold14096_cov124-Isochrysis_galbana.AAC.2